MVCTMYFYAEDQNGKALPFAADFVLQKWDGSRWVVEGTYTISRGGYYVKTGLIDYPQSYKAIPLLDVRYEDDWTRPRDKTFTCRSPDITFVYEAIEPEPTIGALQISSTPSDGWIYIGRTESDLLYFGITTHALVREPGTWYVQVRNVSGYQDSEIRAVTVNSGETTYEHFDLVPLLIEGTIQVRSNPTVAFVYVDDAYVGLTPGTFNLASGSYTVSVDKAGYLRSSMTVTVFSGETTPLWFELTPEPPKPIICLPSIPDFNIPDEIRITFPPPPPAIPTPGPPPLPSLDTPSVPVTFMAAMNCTRDGMSVSDQFPFPAELLLMGSTVGPPITVNAGNNAIDIANAITSLLLAGKITPDLTGILVSLRYPTRIEDGTVTADTTTELWLHISKIVLEHPIICLPAISDFTYPPEIKLTPVPGGLPTLDPALDPVTFIASMNCTQGGIPAADMAPFSAELYVAGGMIGMIPVSAGTNTIPATQLASAINAAIAAGAITPGMTGFPIELRYPARIEDGIVTEYASVERTVSISEIRDIFCDLAVTASDPGVIPFDIPTVGALPTLAVPIPITAMFAAVCDNEAPADLLTYIDAEVRVNDVLFGTIRPDIAGKIDFNLATNTAWLSSIAPGATTMELKIRFPRQLKCTTPTPYGGTQDYTKLIRIEIKLPVIPPCVLTDADFFTCPDGTVIQINECVNGIKVPTGQTCPLPPVPECVLTDADFFTCPDGTIIQLNECVNGIKVPTGQTCPLPPVPECVLTDADFFTCPDGTVIQINECVNGVKVPTGQTCPIPVPECVLTEFDFLTCPDGTVIQLLECVNGVKVPTGQTCPVAPPECVLTEFDFYTCPDGTVIQLNECVNGVKVPIIPTPTCPPVVPPVAPPAPAPPVPAVARAMVMAVPNIVPEGRTVDVVVQSLCAGVESDGEDATLLVDDVAVMTRPTAAGEVTFRWTAAEIGTRIMVCVSIPASEICPYPGAVCRPVDVVTYLPEVKEQVAREMSEYETELAKLRKIRELERERLRGVAVSPGTVRVPPSLAGSTVVIGGIPRVVPPGGISITVPAGEEIVTIIKEGVEERVPVLILPGETEKLPWSS